MLFLVGWLLKGRHGSDQFTKLLFESGHKFSVRLDANVSVEVVVTRKSNTIRNFTCTVLQCPLVLTSLKASSVSATVPTLNAQATYWCISATGLLRDLTFHAEIKVADQTC